MTLPGEWTREIEEMQLLVNLEEVLAVIDQVAHEENTGRDRFRHDRSPKEHCEGGSPGSIQSKRKLHRDVPVVAVHASLVCHRLCQKAIDPSMQDRSYKEVSAEV